MGSRHGRAHELASGPGHQLGEPVRLVRRDRAIVVPVREPGHGHLVAVALARRGLGQTHAAHLGVGERAPRHRRVLDLRPALEEGVGHDGPRVIRRDVREREGVHRVARRVDVLPGGGETLVDLDPAAFVGLDPDRLEAHPAGLGRAPRGDEHPVERQSLPPAVALDDERAMLDLHRAPAQVQNDPIRAQPLGDKLARLRFLLGEHVTPPLDERDIAPKPAEGLAELAADRPAAENDEPARLLGEVPDRLARQRIGLAEALDAGHARARARGYQGRAVPDLPAVHGDRPGTRERAASLDHVDAVAAEAFCRVVRLDGPPRRVHARQHARKVDVWLRRLEAERVGTAHLVRQVGGRDEALARDAARPEAVASQAPALDDDDARPQPRGQA
jgi:hypothetical protein